MNRSQADINKNVDMIAARRREREYFANSPEYRHLAQRMGSEHLAKMLSNVCIYACCHFTYLYSEFYIINKLSVIILVVGCYMLYNG